MHCLQNAYSDFESEQERSKQMDNEYLKKRVHPKSIARNPDRERFEHTRKLRVVTKYLAQARESLIKHEWAVVKELYENVSAISSMVHFWVFSMMCSDNYPN